MHILFLTDNFPPETNAPASRTYEHSLRWVKAGHRVTVITCAPNFPSGVVHAGYANRFNRSTMNGIEVIRVWTYITANEGFARRTLDYLSFGIMAVFAGLPVKQPDVIVGTSPQFFAACAAYVLSVLKHRPFVFELRDLWPDSITAVGAMKSGIAVRMLKKLEYFLYRRARKIVSVTWSFKQILTGNGVSEAKISVVPNGADLSSYSPGDKQRALVSKFGLEGKFVAAYVGTVGMAHGLRSLLDAAAMLLDDPDVRILIIGTGAERQALEALAKERGLHNVVFVGSVPKVEVLQYWRLCDVALVLLRDAALFRHVIPSKMFEAMAVERPIVLGVAGESAGILERSGAGIIIPPEDAAGIAGAIRQLKGNPAQAAAFGRSGREFVTREFDRDILARRMADELSAAARQGKGT